MKTVIIGVFAHPDDEAFGPSGTLLRETMNGNEVHLVSLTCGQAGQNPDNHENLGKVREAEWRAAGELIGATNMHYLCYEDSHLDNQDMIEIADKIQELAGNVLDQLGPDDRLEFMSSDLNGISGHIDHIVAARAVCLAFYRLKAADTRITCVRLVCVPDTTFESVNVEWIFAEPGRNKREIDEINDNRDLREQIVKIMRCHRTQREDYEYHMKNRGDQIGLDHFIVLR